MRKALSPLLLLYSFFTNAQPISKQIPVTDVYFGRTVTDNYRWLEDMNNKEVQDWFRAQHNYTDSLLARIPGRDSLFQDYKSLDALATATISDITRKANRYFYKKVLAGENVGKLYWREGRTGKEILLYDPVAVKDGKTYSINYFVPSEDGKLLAFGVSEGGAEVATIHIINVDTKSPYPETIYPSWFGVSGFSPDNKGFIYTVQMTADNKSMNMLANTRVLYHVVGTDPKTDVEVLSLKKYPSLGIVPEDICFVFYTPDFKWIIGFLGGVNNDINCLYAPASDLLKPVIGWKHLLKKADQVTNFVIRGDEAYMLTYTGASKYKVIKSDLKNFDVKTATVIVPESKDKIVDISGTKDFLVITYSDGINSSAKQYNVHTGELSPLQLPFSGDATLLSYDIKSNDVLVYLNSWKQPTTLFDYNADTKKMESSAFNIKTDYPSVSDIVVEEVEATSYDGQQVPLSILYNKKFKKDGTANCILDGYGAYGISATPYFSITMLGVINRGVVVAYAHVRGGGEKGEDWYKAGYKITKPNTWKDFIACAEWLIKNQYTSANKLTGFGTSAGGVLIGRAITERPDLFGAAICNVGIVNALRFENTPNGPNNAREFGTVKDSAECMGLYEMDAFQHVKPGTAYPAVICVGGINDPRVIPWQPGKFAAALQNATSSGKPVVFDVNYDNGHFTEDKLVKDKNFSNIFSFALWQTGHPDFRAKP
jgi:prolyl oligopeptidase